MLQLEVNILAEAALKPLQHIPAHYVALTHFVETQAKQSSYSTCFCTHWAKSVCQFKPETSQFLCVRSIRIPS